MIPARASMNLDELNFDLPPERIAQRPLATRDASRMMLLDKTTGAWDDRHFREFPDLLRGDELIILNNARVLPARLFGRRVGIHAEPPGIHNPARHEHLRTPIEVLLIRQLLPDTWETLVRPGRKIAVGEKIIFGERAHDGGPELEAVTESRGDYGLRVLRFSSKSGFHEALARLGHIPLPPYIKRADEPADRERYQTIYAREGSAVAAPPRGCTSRRKFCNASARETSKSQKSHWTSASAPSSRSARSAWKTTKYTSNPTKFPQPPRKQSPNRKKKREQSSPSAPQ